MKRRGKFLNCPVCNKAFYAKPHRIKEHKNLYCSQRCHYQHKPVLILEKTTEQYSESWQELIYKWYVVDKIPVRQITKRLDLTNRIIPKALRFLNIPQRSPHDRITLQWIGNEKRKKENAKRMSNLFKGKPVWNSGLTKESHPSINRQAKWMIGSNNPMYGIRGKNHHCYKSGKYTAEKKRFWSTSEYQQWRKAVYERDNYTCQKCGDNKGGNLNAHHIKSFVDYPRLRYVVSNGITLCEKCHIFIHSSIQPETVHRHLGCSGADSTFS